MNIPEAKGIDYSKIVCDTKLKNIHCRDPFIMLCGETYYLYRNDGIGIVCHISKDLENWSKEITVYSPPKDFYGIGDMFWAPECHYWKGSFYIFTYCRSKFTEKRAISVYKSISPLGPFEEISNGPITPNEWSSIDGTLYIDDEGKPWMVFVHEWVSMPDGNGSMVAAKLSEDLSRLISEPVHLFYAYDLPGATFGVTDGCYVAKLGSGKLLMIWSNFTEKGYVIAKAVSETGRIEGPWRQDGILYMKDLEKDFKYDGGHGMIFQTKAGKMCLTFHSPNEAKDGLFESVIIKELDESTESIFIK